MITLDHLDVRLLELLSRNARAGVMELAQQLSVARNTVAARLKRLETAGVLDGFAPRLNLAPLGVSVRAFLALELEQGQLDHVVASLAAIPEVLEVHATTGREDLLVQAAARTHDGLQDLIQKVVSIHGVAHSNTTLALTTPLPFRVQPLIDTLVD
ncbi:Lrp/AsnC family transcriptional regulator [Gordonia sp. (in: high G+C Gram-positive bacteria)]|jgi:DNA-binding Lrp family transcriptional regulator|uniref:Lrp/AsnC family transcriptional regulator n=1 Tax=Gordonia sp. (in: high G+C Gram-positive bacteria) TaxID=84139 RepID=UPI00260437B8|nr:Lrp/AsnC family transcriptional regulator [Gordonia sp. (in: high G+C Gram-positive bacteria)]HMS75697.1 Lrp/AsnC family transcriptional regulator [Gordonia sp. (in: high G+C Gram-positive bacteria)]HQV19996.1 Lrp/AsnC family transcriptional regulator [Gordonia sp. (in: high G+C Gram-positive bacteria)]